MRRRSLLWGPPDVGKKIEKKRGPSGWKGKGLKLFPQANLNLQKGAGCRTLPWGWGEDSHEICLNRGIGEGGAWVGSPGSSEKKDVSQGGASDQKKRRWGRIAGRGEKEPPQRKFSGGC